MMEFTGMMGGHFNDVADKEKEKAEKEKLEAEAK